MCILTDVRMYKYMYRYLVAKLNILAVTAIGGSHSHHQNYVETYTLQQKGKFYMDHSVCTEQQEIIIKQY